MALNIPQLYEQSGSTSAKVVDAYASMAEFCDAQYKQVISLQFIIYLFMFILNQFMISSQICKYMKSKDYEDKKELMQKLSVESRSVKELAKVVDRDVKTAVYIKEQHLKIDVEEVIKSLIYAISKL